jgi:hypothetical protein
MLLDTEARLNGELVQPVTGMTAPAGIKKDPHRQSKAI